MSETVISKTSHSDTKIGNKDWY